MAAKGPPAWAYLVAALLFVASGAFLVLQDVSTPGGVILGLMGIAFGYLGVKEGQRAIRLLQPAGTAAPVAAAPEGPKARPREASVDDYANVAAVRELQQKPKRTCPECRSPVQESAKECPTCSTPL